MNRPWDADDQGDLRGQPLPPKSNKIVIEEVLAGTASIGTLHAVQQPYAMENGPPAFFGWGLIGC